MSRRARAVAVALVAAIFSALVVTEAPANPLDEFLPLVAAKRILAGEVPHRDFFTLYPPLVPLLDALVLSLTGSALLGARLLCVAFLAVGAAIVSEIVAILAQDERAGLAAGLCVAASCCEPPWGYPAVHATVLVLASFLVALRGTGTRAAIAAGLLLGVGALARHDVAGFACLPVAATVFARTGSARRAALLLGVAAAPAALAALVLLALGGGPAAWNELFRFPATLYGRARRLPWPGLDAGSLGAIYLPLAVAVAALARALLDPMSERKKRPPELAAASLPLLLALSGTVRPDGSHLYPARFASLVALAVLLRPSPRQRLRHASFLLGAVLAGSSALLGAKDALIQARAVLAAPHVVTGPRRGVVEDESVARKNTLAELARLARGGRIYVGLRRHEQILLNDVALYLDSGLLPATRWHELVPLVADTEPVQW
ncbi:MAG TPA: hypothetical protein VFF73_32965, partial [Planctomycetota bacterium]|nr:hypothetical protein [Planctomycetota bacterium]